MDAKAQGLADPLYLQKVINQWWIPEFPTRLPLEAKCQMSVRHENRLETGTLYKVSCCYIEDVFVCPPHVGRRYESRRTEVSTYYMLINLDSCCTIIGGGGSFSSWGISQVLINDFLLDFVYLTR
ncbi:hypothetical protein CEXT_286901 [Caerostris extrusa]|uniref:Uncharacterized protein n=1 Tax=Caerostris extrusa TaxID=172846 RepID=A0AAV4NNF0_CAEEX|nr:hypothetical protein CEXT_286901 [Caerostris extrusa]